LTIAQHEFLKGAMVLGAHVDNKIPRVFCELRPESRVAAAEMKRVGLLDRTRRGNKNTSVGADYNQNIPVLKGE
jgi:hypothetical protein